VPQSPGDVPTTDSLLTHRQHAGMQSQAGYQMFNVIGCVVDSKTLHEPGNLTINKKLMRIVASRLDNPGPF
jgi:hypothetical protein